MVFATAVTAAGVISSVSAQEAVTARSAALKQFHQKLTVIAPTDVNKRRELAAWAAGHGLLDEADRLYRQLLEDNRSDDESRAALSRLAVSRKLPAQSAPLEGAQAALPEHFTAMESAHFVVLSDAGLNRARAYAELLERAEHQFRRFAARLNLQPLPLEHKLVCILFRSAADYRKFAAAQDNITATWITGHYSPAHDRVVFYDAELAPLPTDSLVELDQAQARIASLETQARRAEQSQQPQQAVFLRSQAADLKRRMNGAREQLETFSRQSAIATAVHEATHQLLHHTRVQSPYVRAPMWVGEGLASCFETDTPRQAFGPDHEYAPRRGDFQHYLETNQLLPLRELVQIDSLADSENERASIVYSQSYALVKWLCRFRTDGMRKYLAALRAEPDGEPTAQRHLELFQQAFGECAPLERAWLRFERSNSSAKTLTAADP